MEKTLKRAFGFHTYYEIWCRDEKQCQKRVRKIKDIFSGYERANKFICQTKHINFKEGTKYVICVDAPGSVWKDIIQELDIVKRDPLNWD